MTTATPEQRAIAAAEALSADGNPVTARAVQQAAGIGMNVAMKVAKEWNAQQARQQDLPPIPGQVMTRVDGLWRGAVEAAREEHRVAADGWAARVATAEQERDAAVESEAQVQAALDQANARIAELEAAVERAQAESASANEHAVAAQTRATAAESLAAGLREALATINIASSTKN